MELRLFPNAKEITESFGAYNAVRKHFRKICTFDDKTMNIVVVGDGSTPRTAATFAFRSKFQCHSVDPLMKFENTKRLRIDRLFTYAKKIEECEFNFDRVIILHVHSHVKIETSLKYIKGNERHVVAMPCCVPQTLERKPDVEYIDWNILSPKNTIKIWRDV
jgi:hypothetical protein